jgi:hypothetical protein
MAFIHFWVVFGLFSSVTSAGLCLQCRFSGVKFAPVRGRHLRTYRNGADLTPGVRRCTHRADDVSEVNKPHHLGNSRRRT